LVRKGRNLGYDKIGKMRPELGQRKRVRIKKNCLTYRIAQEEGKKGRAGVIDTWRFAERSNLMFEAPVP